MECDHTAADPTRLFCTGCGKLKEPGSLRDIRFDGFLGKESLNPNMERFWASGDPSAFATPNR